LGSDNSDEKLLFVDGLNIICEHFYSYIEKKRFTATSIVEEPTLETSLVTSDQKSLPTWSYWLLPMETRLPKVTGSQIRDFGFRRPLSIKMIALLKGELFCSAAVSLLAS
jgi:hypothetical protein